MRIGMKIKMVNDHLYSVIKANGYKSINAFACDCGFSPITIGNYLNLKQFPRTKEMCSRLEKALKVPIDVLFPTDLCEEIIKMQKLKQQFAPFYLTKEVEHLALASVPVKELAFTPHENKDRDECLSEALGTLSERLEELIRFRFGFDGDPHTLEETAEKYNVTTERIRQLEAKALRQLRHPKRTTIIVGANG